ncbi:response regulator transcription factor [Neobacillus niacini]|uniref:response regulator transcription factor n=1 Tax=Neobacillus niacini TaxID=86668 RepID=UPI00286C4AD1|nr:response regulator transcription factor [Neobacillus niacini]
MRTNKNIKILLVDDERSILQFLELGLIEEGFEVRSAQDGVSAIDVAKVFKPHVVILDVMMPGMNGFEVCRILKKPGNIAVIMLTAKGDEEDRMKGLDLGADDYMVKPFSFGELVARIHAKIRNQFPILSEDIVIGPFKIDDRRREIRFNENSLKLSPTEYELLRLLVINHGLVLSKSNILNKVWGNDFNKEENIVEVYIRLLREKLDDHKRTLIRTIRGAGYRLDIA